MTSQASKSSFRDPAGFVFSTNNVFFRQINLSGKDDYQKFMQSGLYQTLIADNLLIPHEETDLPCPVPETGWKVIKPEKIDFVSYPYEWSFSQFKDAAMATIALQKHALKHNMTLKDASAYNIQFQRMKPVMIDSLSFAPYVEGSPWVAYRQFCQHFLAPLALMAHKDIRLQQLLKNNIDGIPLDLASKLLPYRSNLSLPLLMHITLHAKSQSYYSDKVTQTATSQAKMPLTSLLGLIDSLETGIARLSYQPDSSQWGNYYSETNYSDSASEHKKLLVKQFLAEAKPETLWDLGANTGVYSRIATAEKIRTVAFDTDVNAVEKNYLHSKSADDRFMLPLLLDLTNPSPAIGWENSERMSFMQRGSADTIMALALVHHLAIANNLPLEKIADFFSNLCRNLIIEFVPKADSQVKRLLATRGDIFTGYTKQNFEAVFSNHFSICKAEQIKDSERTLYLMVRKRS